LDYLVKPIDLGELKEAIKRYKESIEKTPQRENLTLELHNWNTKEVSGHKLTLQTQDGALRLIIKDIIRIEGERNYSFIYLKDGKNKLVTKTLTDLEELLNDKGFFRYHKSHLINFIHIKSYQKSFSVLLNEDTEIPIARRRKEDFKLWYDSYEG
jgi:two-component system LytT family response regulator